MNAKKRIRIGTILILAGFAVFLTVSLLTADKPELSILGPISAGLLGGCLVAGIEQIQSGRDPRREKEKRIEQNDERNQLIRGKAAYITLCITDVLILCFGAYVFHVLGNETAGLICYGIALAAWIIYGIAYRIIGKKV